MYKAVHLEIWELKSNYAHPPFERSFDRRINHVYETHHRIFLDLNGVPKIELVRICGKFLVRNVVLDTIIRVIDGNQLITDDEITKLYDDMASVELEITHVSMNT